MDGDFFKLDDGMRELGYTLLAGIALAAYVATVLATKATRDRQALRRELWGRHLSLAVVALLSVASAAAIACFASPRIEDYAFREGGVFEALSAGSFLSVIFLATGSWKYLRDRSVVNTGLLLLGLGGFLDEMSYGMRQFEFHPPIVGTIYIDGFHDMLEWTYRGKEVAPLADLPLLITFLLAVAGSMVLAAWWKRAWIARGIGECLASPAIWYAPWFLTLGIVSCVIDFGAWSMPLGRVPNIGIYVEEGLEMSAALSVCYAWYANCRARQFENSQSRPKAAPVTVTRLAA